MIPWKHNTYTNGLTIKFAPNYGVSVTNEYGTSLIMTWEQVNALVKEVQFEQERKPRSQ